MDDNVGSRQRGNYNLPGIRSLTDGSPTRSSGQQEQQPQQHNRQQQQQQQQQYMAPQHVRHDPSIYYTPQQRQQASPAGDTQYHYSSTPHQQTPHTQPQLLDEYGPPPASQYPQQQHVLSSRYGNERPPPSVPPHRHSFDGAKQHHPPAPYGSHHTPSYTSAERYAEVYSPPSSSLSSYPRYSGYSSGQHPHHSHSSSGQVYRPPPPLLPPTPSSHGAPTTTPATPHSYYQQGYRHPNQNHQHQQTVAHNAASRYVQPLPVYNSSAPTRQSQAPLRDDAYPAAQPPLPTGAGHHGRSPPYDSHFHQHQHPGMSRVGSSSVVSPTARIGSAIEHMSIEVQANTPAALPPQQQHGLPDAVAAAPREEGSEAPLQTQLPSLSTTNPVAAPQINSQSGVDNNSDSSGGEDNDDDDADDGEVDDALIKRRKRNAQSAARLRERRKNREQELTQSCTVLMAQISQLETELDVEKRRAMVDMRNHSEVSISTTTGTATPLVTTDSGISLLSADVAASSYAGTKRHLVSVNDNDDVAMQGGDGSTANASAVEDGGPRKRSRPLRELDRARLSDLKIKIDSLGKLNQHVCVNLGILRQEILRISQAVVGQQKDNS